MGNPFERKFRAFATHLSAKSAQDHADTTATKSGEIFRDKPFTEEYCTVYRVAVVGQSLSQVVTFCTTAALGVFALTHIVPTWWGIYLAVPLGIAFAFGVERLKRSTLSIASKHLLKYRTFGFVGVVAALTLCVSIAAALYGAKELPGIVYPVPTRAVDPASAETLTAEINRVQTDIDRLQANLKGGKNWVAENRTLPRLQKERAALVERRDAANNAAEGRADAQHAEALTDRADKVAKMQAYSVGAAIVAELVFLLCTAFVFYYLFRHFAETQPDETPTPDNKGQAPGFIYNPNGATTTTANGQPQNIARRPIGFFPNRSVSNATVTKQDKNPFVKNCAHCQKEFMAKVAWQKFCAEPCKLAHHEQRHGRRFDPKQYRKRQNLTS
ncbi:MAG: hypothetical protein U0U46_08900 [Saprospiraceae bacterium]